MRVQRATVQTIKKVCDQRFLCADPIRGCAILQKLAGCGTFAGLFSLTRTYLEEVLMKKFAIACSAATVLVSSAYAATTTMTAAPSDSWTITDYYKQDVYDPQQSKIGTVDDVLVDKSGRVTGLVIGVGGFLGAGEKDVIVPFTSVKGQKKNDKWWLTLDETKDNLKNAPGFQYNKSSTAWEPEKK
jgi:sporulation protein YlmC with PRC-barrel domain